MPSVVGSQMCIRERYLIRDNDRKFGPAFEQVAAVRGIEVLKTPIATPKANALCERLMGTLHFGVSCKQTAE